MDRRQFNKGTKGNKGGGRMTAKEVEWHREKWEADTDLEQLENKIASKRFSPRDVYLFKALGGDTVILKNMADKVLADLHDVTSNGETVIQPINYANSTPPSIPA